MYGFVVALFPSRCSKLEERISSLSSGKQFHRRSQRTLCQLTRFGRLVCVNQKAANISFTHVSSPRSIPNMARRMSILIFQSAKANIRLMPYC